MHRSNIGRTPNLRGRPTSSVREERSPAPGKVQAPGSVTQVPPNQDALLCPAWRVFEALRLPVDAVEAGQPPGG